MTNPRPLGALRPQPDDPAVLRHDRLPPCPVCAYRPDAISLAEGGATCPTPSDGDYSLCFNCGEVSVYTAGPLGLAVRAATTDELARFNREHGHVARGLARFNAQRQR